jgi:hypothetical protein
METAFRDAITLNQEQYVNNNNNNNNNNNDQLCGLIVRVPVYRSRGSGSIAGATTYSV